jgi:hypothetical protein
MIGLMSSPFRFKKKERKRWLRSAKKSVIAADKIESEGTNPDAVVVWRRHAELSTRIARAKRRKKKFKNSN